jgi:murein DD-endopeptidase MepM/ murein hydrolase activator NlpD
LEQPYRVQPGDTLEQIARRYNVPPELLAKINGIRDPRNLAPGRELKVIRGPFSALVDLGRRELTLMVQGRYAGRFPIDVAGPDAIAPGTYMVRDKKDVRPRLGDPVAGQVGTFLISLGGPAAIGDRNNAPVALGSRDLEDVFGILSLGSRVVIQR